MEEESTELSGKTKKVKKSDELKLTGTYSSFAVYAFFKND